MTDLADEILANSEKLNKKQLETERVIKIVFGFIQKCPRWEDAFMRRQKQVSTTTCDWRLSFAGGLGVACYYHGPAACIIYSFGTSNYGGYADLQQKRDFGAIRYARQDLSEFIERLIEIFPELKRDLGQLELAAA